MTKQNIIDIVSEATGLTKVETEAVMNGVMKTKYQLKAIHNMALENIRMMIMVGRFCLLI